MILIGSKALSYHIGVPRRINDLDLVGTYDQAVEFRKRFKATSFYPINSGKSIFMRNAQGKICEIEVAWEGSRAEKFLEFIYFVGVTNSRDILFDEENHWKIPCLDILYLLKMSHRYLKDSPHFTKTMRDIQWMRGFGANIRPEHQEFYEERMRDTYTYKHPKLDVAKGDFFDPAGTGVLYVYDHDSIHMAVKHLVKPAYTYFKPDESEVYCSKDLFDKQPEIVKLYSVIEEAYVLAIERSLVPYPGKKTPKEAFDMALMKVCTSITSGWWREYAWENYDKAQELYNDGYWLKFQQGLATGVVKMFDENQKLY